jgi:hypothetical protein
MVPLDITAAIAMVAAALITAISNIIVSRTVGKVQDKMVNIGEKVDNVKEDIKIVHGIVNSAATAQDVKVAQLEKDIATLKQLLLESKERAQLLAQSNAIEKSQSPIIIGERRKNDS